jgi:hypothetical protein
LFIGGLFTDHWIGYFRPNIAALTQFGLITERSTINSDASILDNAAAIRKDVLTLFQRTRKPVVIVAQSKGGVDAAAAFSMYGAELKPYVRGLVALQAPLAGSPLPTDLVDSSLSGVIKGFIKLLFKGDPKSLSDLSYPDRQTWFRAHPYTPNLAFPTVCVATATTRFLSFLAAPAKYVRDKYGVQNDGLVAVNDALFPGSLAVELSDMDHADLVFLDKAHFGTYSSKAATLASIWILLSETTAPF